MEREGGRVLEIDKESGGERGEKKGGRLRRIERERKTETERHREIEKERESEG